MQWMVDLNVWVFWPNTNVVTMLVADTRTLDVELGVNAVLFHINIKEFMSDIDGSWGRVLGIMDTL